MNKKLSLISGILLCLIACQQDYLTKQNQELILGEWRAIDQDDYYPVYRDGYHFMEDNLCINNLGFYSYFISKGFLLHAPHVFCIKKSDIPLYLFGEETELNNVNHYYGNRTGYKIEKDTLKIYDPAKNAWQNQHIRFVSPDTMILSSINECRDSIHIPFVRTIYQTDDKPLFDRLIFYTPHGVWDEKMFSIERDGTFISYGYKGENEFFVGKMKEGEFEQMENLFRKMDFNRLKGGVNGYYYFAPKILFIKDHEIAFVSSMMVPDKNKEYYWAYLTALFSPYDIYLKPAGENDPQEEFLNSTDLYSYELKGTGRRIDLHRTELFYLNILLSKANESTTGFDPVYKLISGDRQIVTDGRYYLLTDQEGNQKTLDIGFNFIEDLQREYINPPEGNTVSIYY